MRSQLFFGALFSLLFLGAFAHAGAVLDLKFRSLDQIKYTVVILSELPAAFRVSEVKITLMDDYKDYEIKAVDKNGNFCMIVSGHELGDEPEQSDLTKRRSVDTVPFGKVDLWYLSGKDRRELLNDDTIERSSIGTEWVNIKAALKRNKEVVSYSFNCEGVSEKDALQMLTHLKILR